MNGHVRGGLGRSRRLAGHEIGHTGIGFQATQQLYAGVQEVIDLSLVIAFLALALGEDHIVDRIRIEIGQRPYIVFGNAVNAQCGRRLVHNLVDQTIHLLLIVRRLLGRSGLEAFTLVTLRMVLDFVIQLLGLRLPRHTPMLCDLPCGLLIDHGSGVVIGETAEIGDYCLLYQGCTLGGTGKDHGKRHPTLGNNVMVGCGAKVLGPFTVGDNAKIAANAVVLEPVPANSTAVGVPARIVKQNGKRTCDLDQVHIPDPVAQELCQTRIQIAKLEKRVAELEKLGKKDQ